VPLRFFKNPCLFLLLNALAACAALNVGSIDAVTKRDPTTADPADLRVAIIVPKELVLRRGDATLGLSRREAGLDTENLAWSLDVQAGGASDRSVKDSVSSGEALYVLALTGADAVRLREFQRKSAAGKPAERGSLSVNFSGGCWRGPFPAGRKVTINLWMQTAPGADYFPVLSNLDLMRVLSQAKVTALPACTA
jgi:hypothetical protein